MPISHEAATEMSNSLIRVMKLFGSMRQHAPRLHPAVDAHAYPLLFNLTQEPRRVSTLAECVHSDVSTVSRQVSSLVSHGLVEKLPDPQDGRAWVLSLTPAGVDLVQRLRYQRGRWFETMLQGWTPEEGAAFTTALDRFAADLEASRDQVFKHYADSLSGVGTPDPATADHHLAPTKEQ